jgi:8-oxo-dGTP pyrophosphatase MutT (NUDIX family)
MILYVAEKEKAMNSNLISQIPSTRTRLHHGDSATQKDLDKIATEWHGLKEILRPNEKDELLEIADAHGQPTGLIAQRWLCHVLGLRHRCVHIALRWTAPGLGKVFVLQVRNWNRLDSPGHLDISVGGHVKYSAGDIHKDERHWIGKTAYDEMEEEIGIKKTDLRPDALIYCGGYESVERRDRDHFLNVEWREVFIADMDAMAFTGINFQDEEVVGLYLCPEAEMKNLLDKSKNRHLKIASALRESLRRCLD